MLMTVLKGEQATAQSKALIRLFKQMKDYIAAENAPDVSARMVALATQTSQTRIKHRQIRGNFSAHIEKSIISDSFYIEKSIILWYNYVEKSVTSKKDEEVCSSARRMTK